MGESSLPHRRIASACLGLALAACGTSHESSAAPAASTPAASTPGASAPAGTAPSAPGPRATPPAIAAASPAQLAPDFFRAPGATATFIYPRIDDRRWSQSLERTGDTTTIRFTFADGARRARVELTFPPRSATVVSARALAEATGKTLVAQIPGAAIRGPGRALPIPGGASWGVAATATLDGAPIVAGAVVIADGDAAVAIVTIAHAPLYDDPAVARVLDGIYQGVRVGSKVLTPPPATPGVARTGVYLGLGRNLGEYTVRIFDPRGYVYEDEALDLDLDARFQRVAGKADRYTATAAAIQVTRADGRADELAVRDDALELDGHVLCPVANTEGLTLDGTWEAASFTSAPGPITSFSASASSRYAFARDGRYSTSTRVAATTSDTATGAHDVTAGDHASGVGRYAITGDHLVLTSAAGTARVPFYLRACGGKPNLGAIAIAGQLYLHDD
ncbi:MAG: hypothetical protein K8W52_40895 [Deltaproteobacteria bacterium]|nr:hypothetical protein [Deltaproteobacteria bacterium]